MSFFHRISGTRNALNSSLSFISYVGSPRPSMFVFVEGRATRIIFQSPPFPRLGDIVSHQRECCIYFTFVLEGKAGRHQRAKANSGLLPHTFSSSTPQFTD